jgi:FtsH-binding integral membrane protein
MSYGIDYALPAAEAPAEARAAFIRRTYGHVAGAIVAFVCIAGVLLNLPGIDSALMAFFGLGRMSWLIVLGAFMAVSWLAERWAQSDVSPGTQYAGLGLYVLAEALIFLPILWVATTFPKFEGVVTQAGLMTLMVAGGLTMAVLITKKDFSFLRTGLIIFSWVAFGLILVAVLFGFNLGTWFSLAMVGFASACIIYQTSNILHHYRTDQHVAAALALFASIALLFWYILQLFMRSRD